ncbi:hypothetical protein [Albidovulum sp.]|jgi:hypothetical protein|uniref:hypothetical protein n=1 Tax=Albidovulum sp. TaxID=1872424 RepID=UPI003045D34A
MMRVLATTVFLAGCMTGDPTGSVTRMTLEYQVGEELMNDCTVRRSRCPEWLEFKRDWEADVNYMTTFERSLAAHKARVAAGGAV